MKELTIEKKAGAYDEALKLAKDYHEDKNCFEYLKSILEDIFPELKESEDEKIKKELIEHIKANKEADYVLFQKFSPDDVIAWLKKQCDDGWGEGDVVRHGGILALVTNGRNAIKSNLEQITIQYPDEWVKAHTKERKYFFEELEKHGKQKPFNYENANIQQKDFAPKSAMEAIKEEKVDNQNCVKPADKVESKFKVKYAGSEYNVLEVKDIDGVIFYGIKDEPNHIDYVKAENCEIISVYAIKENGSPYPTKPAVFSEQNPINKVEPKFKVGDWVVSKTSNLVYHVDSILLPQSKCYYLSHDGCVVIVSFTDEQNYHLWTIADAKDGDVLATQGSVFIFKHLDKTGRSLCKSYCEVIDNSGLGLGFEFSINGVCPATKEQRDLLFAKMKEVGYEWDETKKELKKIEQKSTDKVKPKFKVGDWVIDTDDKEVYYITRIEENFVLINDIIDYEYVSSRDIFEASFRLWTIQDANPGDVLVSKYGSPFIYNGNYNSDFLGAYCGITTGGDFRVGTEKCQWSSNKNVHPATKEQCDLLFAKMKEAGWEWDKDKKELKKIEKQSEKKLIIDGIPIATNYDKWFQNCKLPKFKVGDWVVDMDDKEVFYITKIDENFVIADIDGDEYGISCNTFEDNYRHWTIDDAKDGDVLVLETDEVEWVLIYKKIVTSSLEVPHDLLKYYSLLADNYCDLEGVCAMVTEDYEEYLKPATKEQSDTLMKAMADAGYTFDFEKKELKKIEQETANSAKIGKNDTLLDLLNKMPSCITVDGIDYHFVLKKTIAYMAFYEGEGEGSGKVIFWMAAEPIELLTAMLNKLKEEGLLE